jgi:hypothetical protein
VLKPQIDVNDLAEVVFELSEATVIGDGIERLPCGVVVSFALPFDLTIALEIVINKNGRWVDLQDSQNPSWWQKQDRLLSTYLVGF